MLHKDYLLEVIEQFVSTVAQALARALLQRDFDAVDDVEAAVADLVQLDPETAMALAPESLVTMMLLSGTGDSIAGYAAYALNRLSDAYEAMGQPGLAEMRRNQAVAIADSFGADLEQVPDEFRDLQAQLDAQKA